MRESAPARRNATAEIDLPQIATVSIRSIWLGLRQEPGCFWWLCIYLAVEYVRPQSIFPEIDILPWQKISLGLTIIFWLATPGNCIPASKMTAPIVLFFISALLSSVTATYPQIAFDNFNIQVNWLLLYFLFVAIVNSPKRFFIVLLLLLLASFKMAQHATIAWATRGFTFERWGIAGTPGWFGNAADFGLQMLIFAPLSLAFVLALQANWGLAKKLLFWTFPVAALASIIATGERGTVLGFAAMSVFVILISKQRIRVLLGMSVVALAVYYATPPEFKSRFENMEEDRTAVSRLTYWARGIDMAAEHPYLGIGYSNWQTYYASHYPGESLREGYQEVAHSAPVTILAELGGLGAIAYLWLIFRTLWLNRLTIRRLSSRQDPLRRKFYGRCALGLNVGLLGFLVGSAFVSVQYYPFLWVQACFTSALFRVASEDTADEPGRIYG